MRVLLLDEGFISGTATARGLRAAGCTVDVIAATGGHGRCTIAGGTWQLAPRVADPRLMDIIAAAVRRADYDVIYPVTEPLQHLIWNAKPDWAANVFPHVDERQQRARRDKREMSALIANAGVSIPRQMPAASTADVRNAARELGLPLVIKGTTGRGGNATRICATLEAALAAATELTRDHREPFAQQYIDGVTYLAGGLFDCGRPLRFFSGAKTLQYPPRTGPAAEITSVRDPELTHIARQVFAAAEVTGIASIDLVRDTFGNYHFLELNPRPWGSIDAASNSGVDLFDALARLWRSEPVAPQLDFADGVRSPVFPLYLFAMPYWKSGDARRALGPDVRRALSLARGEPALARHVAHRLVRVGLNWYERGGRHWAALRGGLQRIRPVSWRNATAPLILLLLAACMVVSTTTRSRKVDSTAVAGTRVSSPMKAHLLDGSVIVFEQGASVGSVRVAGSGRQYDITRRATKLVDGVPLDSVVGFEVYQRRVNPLRTLIYAPTTLYASTVGTIVLGAILFGSCPTIYGDSAGVQTLQAESFSYSIAPLLAKRDVDRMSVQPDANGVIRLAVRNEALETHHLDHMEIVEVRHRAEEVAFPSPRGGTLAVSDFVVARVRDRAGRDISRIVAKPDEIAFSTDNHVLDRAIDGGETNDQLTIAVARRPGVDSVALVMKARSSLLTTSVLYEHLMGRQGALALDFMGEDLAKITTLAKLASWYGGNFGMRVEVQDGASWRSVIRLMDFGPTAWRSVGVAIPAVHSADDSVRIRLTFAADAFRIDQISVAQRVRRAEQRLIPIARAVDSDGKARPDIVTMLSKADDRDVETHPGEQFHIEFDAGTAGDTSRTFLFAAQGYYVEWLRPAWMKDAATAESFSASRTTIRDLLRSWRGGRDSLETLFFTRRVPVA